jgi:hypothetical protein
VKTVIIVIVVLAVMAVIAGVVLMSARRRTDQHRHRADQLRTKATARGGAVEAAQRDAAAEQARAEAVRVEAERAEQRSVEAQRELQVEEARQEDTWRAADAVDPDVDTHADGYRPGSAGRRET